MDTFPTTRRTQPTTTAPLSEGTIAIFDNDQAIKETLVSCLEYEGYTTVAAPLLSDLVRTQDANEELRLQQLLGESKPHVFLIDIGANHENHLFTYVNDCLLQPSVIGDAKLIFTSTNAEKLQEFVQKDPRYDMLHKPFDIGELLHKVQKCVQEVIEGRKAILLPETQSELSSPPPNTSRRKTTKKKPAKELKPPQASESTREKEK